MMNMQSAPYLHDRWDDEVALEEEMLALGKQKALDKINRAKAARDMSTLRPQRSLIHEWVLPLAEHIEKWIAAGSAKRGVKSIALPLLKLLPAEVSAVCALRVVTRQLGHETPGLIAIGYELGTWIEHEARARAWKAADAEQWDALTRHYLKRGSNAAHQKRSRIAIFNKFVSEKIGWVNWTDEQRRRVGLELINCVIQATRRFRIVPDPNYKITNHRKGKPKNRMMVLQADDDLLSWLDAATDDELVHSATFLPTLIPPKPWVGPRDGGYWTPFVKTPFLIRFRANHENQKQRAIDDYEALDMPQVYDALNAVQETAWKINAKVLEVAQQFWELDLGLCGLPRREPETKPARPPEADHDPEVHKTWAKEAGAVNTRNAKRVSKYLAARRCLMTAERMNREPCFYFPQMLDFRGRMYPIPSDLSPQGDDLHRGLLTFSEGKKVGPEDAWWLALQVANCFGVDKVSMDERVKWVEDRQDLWFRIANEPIVNREWCEADKGDSAWQALAAIFEWTGYLADPENFVSTLPIRVDGTCNGIQHLSAMIRDEVGGASVNLIPADKPRDIYQEVADELTKLLELDALANEPKAHVWLAAVNGRCPRSLTKRPVMILPYGGTRHSYFEYTMDWLIENDPKHIAIQEHEAFEYVGYMVKKLWEAVGAKVDRARDVMKWLQDNCNLACADGKPLFWKTPSGFIVRQFYGERAKKQIHTEIDGQRVDLVMWETTNVLDPKAQGRAIAPNFVHSMDASCLTTAVNKAWGAGINSITTIHDSYGTVAADMWTLYACIREAFVENHSEPMLEQFQEWCRYVNPKQGLAWPRALPEGSLDLEEVTDSTYFFA